MRSEGAVAAPPFNSALYFFYGSGVVVVGGGFVLYTSGADLSVVGDAGAGSLVSQSILGFYYLLASLLFVSANNFMRIIKGSWPVLILPCLALASATWSPDPALTLRRAFAFGGTVLFGLSLASAYEYRDCSVLICRALVAAMVLSFAAIWFDPRYGIHQINDAVQAVHAGSWRGIFAHRNTLGLWAGATLGILVVIGRDALGTMSWIAAIAAATTCLFYSGSKAGIIIAALFMVCQLVLVLIVRQTPSARVPVFLIVTALALTTIMVLWDDLTTVALALLGRKSDLSGRTYIWYYIIQVAQSFDKPLGLGYFVGTLLLDQRLSAAGEPGFVNAHNGYLEAFIYFGITGAITSILVVLWILVRSIIYLFKMNTVYGQIRTMPTLFIMMVIVHNIVESTLVSPNNLNTLLMAAAGGMVAATRQSAGTPGRAVGDGTVPQIRCE